jgi:hypothetical protein
VTTSVKQWTYPRLKRRVKKIFTQPKAHQNKFANLKKIVPANPLRMIALFKQCQATNKAAGLEKIAKDKKQPKKKSTAYVPTARSRELSYKQHRCHKYCNYHQSDRCDCIVIKMINAMIVVNTTTWTQGKISPTTRRMIAIAITSRKRVTRPCTMTSPLCQARQFGQKKELISISFALLLLFLLLLKQQELQKPSCQTT